jgi:hypothetical protein
MISKSKNIMGVKAKKAVIFQDGTTDYLYSIRRDITKSDLNEYCKKNPLSNISGLMVEDIEKIKNLIQCNDMYFEFDGDFELDEDVLGWIEGLFEFSRHKKGKIIPLNHEEDPYKKIITDVLKDHENKTKAQIIAELEVMMKMIEKGE